MYSHFIYTYASGLTYSVAGTLSFIHIQFCTFTDNFCNKETEPCLCSLMFKVTSRLRTVCTDWILFLLHCLFLLQVLLSILVNKVGDPVRKMAARAVRLLLKLGKEFLLKPKILISCTFTNVSVHILCTPAKPKPFFGKGCK